MLPFRYKALCTLCFSFLCRKPDPLLDRRHLHGCPYPLTTLHLTGLVLQLNADAMRPAFGTLPLGRFRELAAADVVIAGDGVPAMEANTDAAERAANGEAAVGTIRHVSPDHLQPIGTVEHLIDQPAAREGEVKLLRVTWG